MNRTLYLKKKNSKGEEVLFPSSEQPAFITEYTYSAARMGGVPTITGTVKHPLCLDELWTREEYVEFEGVKFYVTQVPTSSKSNDDIRYKHEITFRSERDLLDNIYFFDVVTPQTESQYADRFRSNATKFSFYGDIKEFVSRLNDSLVYSGIGDKFNIVIDEGIESDTKEISFSDKFFSEALQEIFNIFEIPYYWVGNVCHIGHNQGEKIFNEDETLTYGQDKGLLSVLKTNGNYRLIDRITGVGSSQNIPHYYPNDSAVGTSIYEVANMSMADVQSIDLNKILTYNTDVYNTIYVLKYTQPSLDFALDISNERAEYQGTTHYSEGLHSGVRGSVIYGHYVKLSAGSNVVLSDLAANATSYNPEIAIIKQNEYVGVIATGELNITEYEEVPVSKQIIEDGIYFVGIRLKYDILRVQNIDSPPQNFLAVSRSGATRITYKGGDGYVFSYNSEGGQLTIPCDKSGIKLVSPDSLPCTREILTLQTESFYGHTLYEVISSIAEETSPNAPASIHITGRKWVAPQQNLMPPIYLESEGAERFYNAINEKYEHPDGGHYVFLNEYEEGKQREGIVSFDDIMPTIKGVVNAEGKPFGEVVDVTFDAEDSDAQDDEGNYIHSYFYIKLNIFNGDYGFNLFAQALGSGAATINMTSGDCSPCAFEIATEKELIDGTYVFYNPVVTDGSGNLRKVSDINSGSSYLGDYIATIENRDKWTAEQQNTYANSVWIAVKKENSTFGIVMPNGINNHKPKTGDTFVITNILMPNVLVRAAEERLKNQLLEHLAQHNNERFDFSVKLSREYIYTHKDIANKINENSKINVVYNDKAYPLYVTNYTCRADGNILNEISVELATELSPSQNSIQKQISAIKGDITKATSKTKPSSVDLASLDKRYLSKLSDDTAKGEITFEKGAKFGSKRIDAQGNATLGDVNTEDVKASGDVTIGLFTPGLTGNGAKIDRQGRSEMRSLRLWESLEVPEIRYNRISINIGFDFDSVGGGIIESVTPDYDENGTMLNTGTCTLKLEDGEAGAIAKDDLCMGMWHDEGDKDGNATEDSDDRQGSFTRKGFKTVYFHITEIVEESTNNGTFKYTLRSEGGNGVHPYPQMHFAQRGNTTNKERQAFRYSTTEYAISLCDVDSWTFDSSNIYEIRGKLDGFTMLATNDNGEVYTKTFTGYGQVFGNAYMYGAIDQFDKFNVNLKINQSLNGELTEGEKQTITIGVYANEKDLTYEYTFVVTRSDGTKIAEINGDNPTFTLSYSQLTSEHEIFTVVGTHKNNETIIDGVFVVDKLILQEQYMGFWDSTITYMRTRRTFPTVTHLGSKWYLVASSDKGTEPMPNNSVWWLMQGNNELKLKFSNNDNFIVLAKKVNTIVSLHILINDYDVTQKTLSTAYSMSWVRDSGVSADDKAWKPTFVNENGEIIQADKIEERTHLLLRQNEEVKDLGMKWNEVRTCKFIVTIELANDVSLTGEIII